MHDDGVPRNAEPTDGDGVFIRGLAAFGRWLTPARVKAYGITLALVMVVGWGASRTLYHAPGQRLTTDFAAFYTAGQVAGESGFAPTAAQLYDLDAQRTRQREVLRAPVGVNAFLNPPLVAYAFAPLSVLDYPAALGLWVACCTAAFALALLLLSREFALRRRKVWLVACCFWPAIASFAYGQNTAFSLLALTGFMIWLRRERQFWAGVCLGILCFKPQLAFGLGFYLLVSKRWRAAWVALGVAGTFAAVNYLLLPEASSAFVGAIAEGFLAVGGEEFPTWGEMSFLAFGRLLLPGSSGVVLGGLLTLAALGWIVWVGRSAAAPSASALDEQLIVVWPVAILVAPHLYEYDLALLLPGAFLAFKHWGWRLDEQAWLGATALVFLATTFGLFVAAACVSSWGFAVQWTVLALVAWVALAQRSQRLSAHLKNA